MRDPGPVEAVVRLARLVLAHLRERDLVHLRVLAARDERRHAAHGLRAAAVAGAHEELGVRAHERHRHRDLGAVGKDELLPFAELLDQAEDVVPATGVEADRVRAELVEDLVHLESRQDDFDEDRRLHRAALETELVLGEREDVVPEARLEAVLELRQVEVRTGVAPEELGGVVEHVQAEVEEPARDRFAADADVPLVEVPAARADEKRRRLFLQAVRLAFG